MTSASSRSSEKPGINVLTLQVHSFFIYRYVNIIFTDKDLDNSSESRIINVFNNW